MVQIKSARSLSALALGTLLLFCSSCSPIASHERSASLEESLIPLRIEARNLKTQIVKEVQGKSWPLQVCFDNTATASAQASLALNRQRLYPFSPVIPPYVGIHAKEFKTAFYLEKSTGSWTLTCTILRKDLPPVTVMVPKEKISQNQWSEFTTEAAGSLDHPVLQVLFDITAEPGAQVVFYLADPSLTQSDGPSYALFNTDVPMMLAGMQKPLADQPARPLPTRESIIMGGYTIEDPAWMKDLPAMTTFMNQQFPNADFVVSPVWTPQPNLVNILKDMPPGVFFQFQKAQLDARFLNTLGVIPKGLHDLGNSTLALHPTMQKGLQDEVDYAASLGVNNFKQVDYGWPWHARNLGYDPASLAAFRDNLHGRDEGLHMLAGPLGAKTGTIHFWDYFQENHGLRLTPQDVGLKSWDQYEPIRDRQGADGTLEDKRNLAVGAAMVHYEWLKQAQRFGQWAKAHGGRHDYTMNPEDIGNGGDYAYLIRLRDAGIPFIEYFGGPAIIRAAYANLPMYFKTAQQANRQWGVITEIGQGGHGQPYWSPEVGYLMLYELGALGFSHYHNEWMETPWSIMSDPNNPYHYDRFSAWMSQALGWYQARQQNTIRPAAKVAGVSLRSSVHYMQAWIWSIEQMDSFGPALSDAHIDYTQTDTLSLPDTLDQTDVLFYAPPASRQVDADRITAWLKTGGKTLITHSYIPISKDEGDIRIRPRIESIDFRGEEFNYADYIDPMQNLTGAFALHDVFTGLTNEHNNHWALPGSVRQNYLDAKKENEQGWRHVELGIGLEHLSSLVSEIQLPDNSHIVYLHRRPKDYTPRQLQKIMEVLAERYHLPRLAVDEPVLGSPAIVHTFQLGDMQTAIFWNADQLFKLGDSGGYGPYLLPERGPDKFDLKNRPFPIEAPGTQCGGKVFVSKPGTYRVYSFLRNLEQLITVGDDGLLPLSFSDQFAEQFYYAPDTPECRQKIQQLKQHRQQVQPYFSRK